MASYSYTPGNGKDYTPQVMEYQRIMGLVLSQFILSPQSVLMVAEKLSMPFELVDACLTHFIVNQVAQCVGTETCKSSGKVSKHFSADPFFIIEYNENQGRGVKWN